MAQLCRVESSKVYIDNRKKLVIFVNSNISSTCFHNMANFGPLRADIVSGVCDTPSKFQQVSRLGFVTAATSFTGGQPNFARCLAVSGLVWYTIYTFCGLLPPDGILLRAKFTCVLLYCQRYCTALQQRASAKLCGMVQQMELRNFRRGRHLYSTGRPSRWASAHILVL